MNRVPLVCLAQVLLALALSSCGSPAVVPPVTRPDAGAVDQCEGALCFPGESCDPVVGCYCTEDGCPTPAICAEASGRCENLCVNSLCGQGEACVPKTGRCECGGGTDPCPADKYCNPETLRCDTRCTTACPRGESCEPSTGACRCADCAAEGLGCDPTTNRCVDRCPATCPAGERCDDKVVGECHCSDTSCAVGQVCDANRRCVDLCQGKACSPGEKCDAHSGACVCDECGARDRCNPTTNRCEPKCTGVQCPAGEVCTDTNGECHCGISPNTCPAGKKCEAMTLTCVDMCQGVSCPVPGESCSATTGLCGCATSPDSCQAADPSTRCDAAARLCVAQCAGVSCAPGEACNGFTGACECQASPADTCSAAAPNLKCGAASKHCEEKCKAVTCVSGEACVSTSGECHCGIPNTCPAGKKCDTSSLRCVGLCAGVSCTVPGESCDAASGLCACTPTPDSCTTADPSSKCDAGAKKCVSQCAGVGCAPGESCNLGSGKCECAATPADTCTAAVTTNRCDAATLKCVSKCAGISCSAGESCLSASGACACGVSPNTCPAGKKCDPGTLHCVGLCSGVTCTTPGESCDAATGACSCGTAPDTCTPVAATTKCDPATRKCVSKCQGVFCATGETCAPATGLCACTTAPDSCSAADANLKCNATTKHCQAKCAGVSCPSGESCVASTGECHCSLASPTCPAGQRCDAATTRCVAACSGVICSTPGESCNATTGACQCAATPSDTCTAALTTTRCDTASSRCVSKCFAVSCAPGEACDAATASCKCTASPDSCTAVSSGQRCDGATSRCVALCSGVSCGAGETCNPANGQCECAAESCLANYACNPTTKHCEPCAQETDAAFCARMLTECGTATGTDNCGRARTVSCGTCVSPKTCSGGVCLNPSAPANDDCLGAIALVFDGSGKATVNGDTTSATDSGRAAVCAVGFGNDVVYSFTTSAVKNVDLSLTFTGTAAPVLYVRKACASPASADEVGCADGLVPGVAAVSLVNLPAGTYWVWADAYSGGAGPFTLTVQLSNPPAPAANDTCATPTVLSFTSDVATAAGDTRAAAHDYSGTCVATLGGDVVYAVDLATARSLTATVTRDAATPGYLPAVYVRKVCTSALAADEAACAQQVSGVATAVAPTVGPGRVYVVVDGASATSGKFSLQVTLGSTATVPPNDTCSSPTVLTLTNNVASVTSSTTYAAGNTSGNCGGTGNDLVWSVTTTGITTLSARVTPSAGSPTFQPVVYIRGTACEGTSAVEKACTAAASAGASAFTMATSIPAGTYWIWVDGWAGTKGDFTLDVSTVPPNNICSGVLAVVSNATFIGNTFNATADYGGPSSGFSSACQTSNYGAPGPDVVFFFQPTASGSYTFVVTPTAESTTYDTAIWVMPAPCGNNPMACLKYADVGGNGGAETLTFTATANTAYYLVVDSWTSGGTSSKGAFTLSVAGP